MITAFYSYKWSLTIYKISSPYYLTEDMKKRKKERKWEGHWKNIFPFHRWRNQGSERFSNLPKVTKPVSSRAVWKTSLLIPSDVHYTVLMFCKPGVGKLCPTAKIWPAPAFVNKVLLNHSHTIQLHIIYGCFHVMETSGPQSLKYLLPGPFQNNVPTPA